MQARSCSMKPWKKIKVMTVKYVPYLPRLRVC